VRVVDSAHSWARVQKADGDGGWLSTRNLHAQALLPPFPAPHCAKQLLPPPGALAAAALERPRHWLPPRADGGHLRLVPLQEGAAEWARVEGKLRAHLPRARLVRLQRVENAILWAGVQQEAALMALWRRAEEPAVKEMELWHGSGGAHPSLVYNGQDGFDLRFASAGLWGQAIYFAEQSGYSDAYAFDAGGGEKQLLLSRVLLGDEVELAPDRSLRLPPPRPPAFDAAAAAAAAAAGADIFSRAQGGAHCGGPALAPPSPAVRRFDAVTGVGGGGGRSRVHMVYDNRRAYPSYCVTYELGRQPARGGRQPVPAQPAPPPLPPPPPAAVPSWVQAPGSEYALYLLPAPVPAAPAVWQGWAAAHEHQAPLWGMVHATLCSFRPLPAPGSGRDPGCHTLRLGETMARAHAAAGARASCSPYRLRRRQYGPAGRAPLTWWAGSNGVLTLDLPAGSQTLGALCAAIGDGRLDAVVRPRTPPQLHVTLAPVANVPPVPALPLPAAGQGAAVVPDAVMAELSTFTWSIALVCKPPPVQVQGQCVHPAVHVVSSLPLQW
jgi:hypothetical protein